MTIVVVRSHSPFVVEEQLIGGTTVTAICEQLDHRRPAGLEPAAFRLSAECSTYDELRARISFRTLCRSDLRTRLLFALSH